MKVKVALLRGLGRESGHWDPEFLSLLQTRYDVILLDYPGCGPYVKETFPSSMDQVLEHLNKQMNVAEPVFLVAVSLGGMIALQWAEKYPEKFRGLILVNSSASDLSPFYKRLAPTAMKSLVCAATHSDPRQRESEIVELISNNREKHASTIERWAEIAARRPIRLQNILKQLWLASRFRSPKAPLRIPLQILVAEGDRLASSSCSKNMAAKYGAPLTIHNTGGHDLMIDDPHWVSEQIQLFINRRTTA